MLQSLCDQWQFTPEWSEAFLRGQGQGEAVRLPHTVRELPLHYADNEDYQMICGYRRRLSLGQELAGKRLFLRFDGAGHIATVYVNGREVGSHRCGYTGFRVEITDHVTLGQDNLVCVRLDTRENPEVPPFGYVIDYLTYGGLYREAWLDIREQTYLQDLYITTPTLDKLRLEATVDGEDGCSLEVSVTKGGRLIARDTFPAGQPAQLPCPGVKPWDTQHPVRYTCQVRLLKDGRELDCQKVKTGFRVIRFQADGFYLNGKKTFLRGLNRHQCWPYVGYAVPERLQREDARILKEELGCVAVRTSHYPQSHYFIDQCDKLGLLVFTEIPGWQHIGDDGWKDQAVENTREMVLQYRNHPSIILWGVRINESQDDDGLYLRTNAAARELDPSRPTSGVRYIDKSSLLEDVCAFNDFSHTGGNPGCRPKKDLIADRSKALLISEHSGHMFPTKAWDPWQRRQDHALRHARVLSDSAADGEHAGCFGWCMFDYPTHKDFGSGDRVCYHGVLDAFRNPKPAAALYASQGDHSPVLALSGCMDIGDYPGGQIGDLTVFSNADSVSLYKNDRFVTKLSKADFPGLPHPPLNLDDPIGCLLQTQEGFDHQKAELLRQCLLAIRKKGLNGLDLKDRAKIGYAMTRYRLSFRDAMALYGAYVGNWGGAATVWRLEGEKDGAVVSTLTFRPSARLHLQAVPSHTRLVEGASYDMAAVRIRLLDENGNPAPYAQIPVRLRLEGPAVLVGPDVVCAEGGMTGTYIRTCAQSGSVRLTISTDQTQPVALTFQVEAPADSH